MVDAIADAVATRVAINARAVVPAALLQLLQPGAVMYQPLHHLARDQFENMRVVIRAYEHSLVFEFTYHDNQRLCDVVLSAPPAVHMERADEFLQRAADLLEEGGLHRIHEAAEFTKLAKVHVMAARTMMASPYRSDHD